jgi:hypothetical protein
MEPLLFIAYSFPPKAGISVKRSMQFFNNLPEYGYHPVVLTIDRPTILAQNGRLDEQQFQQLQNKDIHQVNDSLLASIYKAANRLRIYRLIWIVFYPFVWELSALFPSKARIKASELIKQNNIRKVYVSCGPFSPALLGIHLKKKLNVRLVVDFRDPLSDGYQWQYPTKFHWYYSRWIEKLIIRHTDILIVNTPEVSKLYKKRYPKWEDKIRVLTNGF